MKASRMWDHMRAEAFRLDNAELLCHARVSSDNRHECRSCFTCACLVEYKRRCEQRYPGVSLWRLVR